MKIYIKEQAASRLAGKLGGGRLKLHYDTEGCGCGVNGVPVLWIVSEPADGDVEIGTNAMPVLVEKSHIVFYADELIIDVSGAHQYRLSSPQEILNGWMNLVRKE
ncbi:iron-sulfur cluster biosynthesis family protein [Bacillus sp. B190/17]|uniref:Iron-sulfur cluster biosynthesis family protein n=1 Tax=Bacillus lumedeiriae TaxID=3058829 RepID=A0ABW8I476_9BACI